MYSNNILNFQESTTILNACTKKVWKLIECTIYIFECRGDVEVINEQILINSGIQAIGDAIDFHDEEGYWSYTLQRDSLFLILDVW